jgi:type VI secretion system protein ImpF
MSHHGLHGLHGHYAPSLLDKLLGTEGPGIARGTHLRLSVDQIKESVARDIEALLNTHPGLSEEALVGYPHAARSLLTLGLSDITSLSMASDRDRQRVKDAIRRALAEHDPRLRDVDVDVRPSAQASTSLSFKIRAKLLLNPDVEPVAFDAVLQRGSKRYDVSRSDRRTDRAQLP